MRETTAAKQGTGQRVVVRVRGGPRAHDKAVLEPGQVLHVGKAVTEGLSLAHDGQMADAHFEISWDGVGCHLRDLKSATGTLVGGQRVEEAELLHGSWVRAGVTDFSVYFEGATPPCEPVEPDAPEMEVHRVQALKVLRRVDAPLFAVLDAARDERILELLRRSVEDYRSLYEGPKGEELAEVAPYLVALPRASKLLEELVREGWGKSWGVFLTCRSSLLEVRRHFRKLLMVEAEGVAGRLYFRFYDPRVLRAVLDAFSPEQCSELFGKISCFIAETESGSVLQLPSSVHFQDQL